MIKAVIFDFFSVLAIKDVESFRQTYFPGDLDKLAENQRITDRLNLGKISYDEFVEGLAKVAGVDKQTVLKYTENYKPNSLLLSYIEKDLKPKYKIGIISNAGEDWVLKILGEKYLKLFDDIILSYKVGYIKPETEIYEMSTEHLGVMPQECVFIDDIMTYCQGAERIGMNTIWYKDFSQFKNELEKILATGADN